MLNGGLVTFPGLVETKSGIFHTTFGYRSKGL
jgi:hypothetical protein